MKLKNILLEMEGEKGSELENLDYVPKTVNDSSYLSSTLKRFSKSQLYKERTYEFFKALLENSLSSKQDFKSFKNFKNTGTGDSDSFKNPYKNLFLILFAKQILASGYTTNQKRKASAIEEGKTLTKDFFTKFNSFVKAQSDISKEDKVKLEERSNLTRKKILSINAESLVTLRKNSTFLDLDEIKSIDSSGKDIINPLFWVKYAASKLEDKKKEVSNAQSSPKENSISIKDDIRIGKKRALNSFKKIKAGTSKLSEAKLREKRYRLIELSEFLKIQNNSMKVLELPGNKKLKSTIEAKLKNNGITEEELTSEKFKQYFSHDTSFIKQINKIETGSGENTEDEEGKEGSKDEEGKEGKEGSKDKVGKEGKEDENISPEEKKEKIKELEKEIAKNPETGESEEKPPAGKIFRKYIIIPDHKGQFPLLTGTSMSTNNTPEKFLAKAQEIETEVKDYLRTRFEKTRSFQNMKKGNKDADQKKEVLDMDIKPETETETETKNESDTSFRGILLNELFGMTKRSKEEKRFRRMGKEVKKGDHINKLFAYAEQYEANEADPYSRIRAKYSAAMIYNKFIEFKQEELNKSGKKEDYTVSQKISSGVKGSVANMKAEFTGTKLGGKISVSALKVKLERRNLFMKRYLDSKIELNEEQKAKKEKLVAVFKIYTKHVVDEKYDLADKIFNYRVKPLIDLTIVTKLGLKMEDLFLKGVGKAVELAKQGLDKKEEFMKNRREGKEASEENNDSQEAGPLNQQIKNKTSEVEKEKEELSTMMMNGANKEQVEEKRNKIRNGIKNIMSLRKKRQ